MAVKLKKLKDQVMVITGASSGIGLTTARMAAKRGTRLVLAARSEDALRQLTDEITSGGGGAVYVVADVGKPEDVKEITRVASRSPVTAGRFWVLTTRSSRGWRRRLSAPATSSSGWGRASCTRLYQTP